ncbi:MAG: hypothetical protein U9P11_10325 [Pseudomonadota bacterium]|nr:hypothetical protein [Pseudomonadota bacterium]
MRCQSCDVLRITGKAALTFILLTCGCLTSTLLAAGELVELDLSHERGVFHLRLEMILEAPHKDVHNVVTDYAHIYRLNPSIVESAVMEMLDDSVVRIKTLINDCILIFCRDILRVEDVRELGTGDIFAVIVPRLSNVKSGAALWQIQPLGSHTRINYYLTLEPGFFIPPAIGTYLVKKKLQQEVLISFSNIERIAQIRSGRTQVTDSVLQEPRSNRGAREYDSAK